MKIMHSGGNPRPALISTLCLLILFSLTLAEAAKAEEYGYFLGNSKITLHASPHLLIIKRPAGVKAIGQQQLTAAGAELDPLSRQTALAARGLELFRRPSTESEPGLTLKKALTDNGAIDEMTTQPVFEQGQALLIPTAELIVILAPETASQGKLPAELCQKLGILKQERLDQQSLLLTIADPGNGRCYQVCSELARQPGISVAEPNHLIIMLDDQSSHRQDIKVSLAANPDSLNLLAGGASYKETSTPATTPADNGWRCLFQLDGEAGDFPPAGWLLKNAAGKTAAAWGPTAHRAKAGRRSIYCAAYGPAAVPAPGPAPLNMAAYLFSPELDLSPYDEAYVEAWFYSKNEIETDQQGKIKPHDLPVIGITDGNSSTEQPLAIVYTGDCTSDPTTVNGWRKCLFRIPPAFHKSGIRICFLYLTNEQNPQEGCYLDEIKLLANNLAQQSLRRISNDPYSSRQYELLNQGQIAGGGGPGQDLNILKAWELTKVKPEIKVAVIDDGVELEHPDLNLAPGKTADGRPGGGPPDDKSFHGTGVAGNIGAISNNGIGVIGTAPGVTIIPINGGSTPVERAQAFRTAVNAGAKIINNSWGWVGAPSALIENAIRETLRAGVTVLFAAGNGPDRPPFSYEVAFPGNLTANSDIICVGASSQNDEHKSASSSDGLFSWGSSYVGAGPDVCAPGPWSYTTDRLGEIGYNNGSSGIDADYCHDFGGTSSSCPKVAGIVALMLSANPTLSPGQVKNILRESADDIEAPGIDDKTGAGRVNAGRAVEMALASLNQARPESPPAAPPSSPGNTAREPYDAFGGPSPRQPRPPVGGSGWQSVVE